MFNHLDMTFSYCEKPEHSLGKHVTIVSSKQNYQGKSEPMCGQLNTPVLVKGNKESILVGCVLPDLVPTTSCH